MIVEDIKLWYPDGWILSDKVVAHVAFRLTDDAGHAVTIRCVKLIRRPSDGKYFLQMPHEPKSQWCEKCRRGNPVHANFCSWCGAPQTPADRQFFDHAAPCNVATRELITGAVVAAHAAEVERRKNG